MKQEKEIICNCSNTTPILLNGSLSGSPRRCIQCKHSVPLNSLTTSTELLTSSYQWLQLYHSFNNLMQGSSEYYQWSKSQLLDETGYINMEGIRLSQQYSATRKCYYWMYQDVDNKDYRQVQTCPFCGASMEKIENNDFKVCHDCMVVYPDEKPLTNKISEKI